MTTLGSGCLNIQIFKRNSHRYISYRNPKIDDISKNLTYASPKEIVSNRYGIFTVLFDTIYGGMLEIHLIYYILNKILVIGLFYL